MSGECLVLGLKFKVETPCMEDIKRAKEHADHQFNLRRGILSFLVCLTMMNAGANEFARLANDSLPDQELIDLSGEFLLAVKTGDSTQLLEARLASLPMSRLISGLNNDEAIKTFWINMYNAWFQVLAGREKMTRPRIFTSKAIPVAGRLFSLDEIEHGILRKYRWKFSMGYLAKPFVAKQLKQLAVKKIDYRVHFALNCGAKSCPPIAFYKYEKINDQLDLAGRVFLRSESTVDVEKKEVTTSKILSWFRGDFGGRKGLRRIVGEAIGQDLSGWKVRFKAYDWETVLGNYLE